ncbi:MAG: prenyltransferase/squalene oxidase repeat-containing protein [Dehalococcoidia bacterium]|nr:prenyltransferase/squalene oxidase repeat-containing protein [Dehalococcoidia bacterium]
MLRKAACFLLAVAAVMAAGYSFVIAATPEQDAAEEALDYIRGLQNADGGFPDFGAGSSPGATLDAVFAFAAAGIDARTVTSGGNSPVDYIEGQAASYSGVAGAAAKLVLGLIALGEDPRDFAGVDFVEKMESYFDAGSYGDGVFDHCLYMLARSKLGLSPAAGSVNHLKSKQMAEGCWEYGDGWGCDTNTTSLAIQALVAADVSPSDSAIEDALDYLAAAQNNDGGFPYLIPSDSDANSTAFVIQALVAAGENIDAGGPWEKQGNTPMEALLAFQNPVTGAFTYGGVDSAYATYQAVPALLLRTYSLPTATPQEETATPKPTKTPTPVMTATETPSPQPVIAPPGGSSLAPTPASQAVTMPRSGGGGETGHDLAPVFAAALLLAAGVGITASLVARRMGKG